MEEKCENLEEGEISDASVDNYIPLERPVNYSGSLPNPRFSTITTTSESEEEFQVSETDSDSDSCIKKSSKKPKIKLKPRPAEKSERSKRYDIWSSKVQTDTLAENLNFCDVTVKDRERNVEYYDFTLAYKSSEDEDNLKKNLFNDQRKTNKRTRDDRNNASFKQKQLTKSKNSDQVKGKKRSILDLNVDVNNSPEDIAKDIGNKLYEEKEDLILRVINVLGKERAIEIFKETKELEEEGGMLIMNQTRRRTPGGVFLFLVRHDYHITPEQKREIFDGEKHKNKHETRTKQKQKLRSWRTAIVMNKTKPPPQLITRTELIINRKSKEADETSPVNPPPTPETDIFENSTDGLEDSIYAINENDFLEVSNSTDMDLF